MNAHSATLKTFSELQPGDLVQLQHEVKVGYQIWHTTTTGTVVETQRRRHSLHHQRSTDDKVFSDVIVLKRDDGELTTVTLDEFSVLRLLQSSPASAEPGA